MNEQQLARGLAAFSVGLGLAELLAPRQVARLVGIDEDDHETLIRLCGLREIGAGVGIMQFRPDYFLWSRVAGDALDLSLLAAALKSERSNRQRVTTAMMAVAGVTVLDIIAGLMHSHDHSEPGWRDPRPMEERGGLERDDAYAMREAADVAMARHQPGESGRTNASIADQQTVPGQSAY